MFYTIYKTTNQINGKFYIGKHVTTDPNDAYLGSGDAIKRAIQKYGKESFIKEILFVYDNEQEMNVKETEIVNRELCIHENCYNIAAGGQGGKIVLYPDHPLYEETCKKISDSKLKDREVQSLRAKQQHREKRIGMYGRAQTEKQKQTVSKVQQGRHRSEAEILKLKSSLARRFQDPTYIHPNKGRSRPDATNAFTKLPRIKCAYCDLETNAGNHARYHGDKCKQKHS